MWRRSQSSPKRWRPMRSIFSRLSAGAKCSRDWSRRGERERAAQGGSAPGSIFFGFSHRGLIGCCSMNVFGIREWILPEERGNHLVRHIPLNAPAVRPLFKIPIFRGGGGGGGKKTPPHPTTEVRRARREFLRRKRKRGGIKTQGTKRNARNL